MLADHILVRGAVNAVDLVVGHIAVDPLDLRAEIAEHVATGLRRILEVCCSQFADSRHVAFDHILRHDSSPPGIDGDRIAYFTRTVAHGCWPTLSATERSEEHTSELQSLMRISYAV